MCYYQGGLLLLLLTLSNFEVVHNEDTLSCYGCNINLKTEQITQECNDPYTGRPGDLVQCPQNGPQQCLKIIVTYKSRHTTVRGCVSSSTIETYYNVKDLHQEAKIEYFFCSSYGCNSSNCPKCNTFIIVLTILMSFKIF